jgi:hypothetical protein
MVLRLDHHNGRLASRLLCVAQWCQRGDTAMGRCGDDGIEGSPVALGCELNSSSQGRNKSSDRDSPLAVTSTTTDATPPGVRMVAVRMNSCWSRSYDGVDDRLHCQLYADALQQGPSTKPGQRDVGFVPTVDENADRLIL